MREEIEKIIKTQQDYTRECTLANGNGIQESIDKPNREYATDQILTLLDKEIQKAKIEELLTHAPDWVEINDDGTVNPTAVFDRIRQLEKGE